MSQTGYMIRAECKNSVFFDARVGAESLNEARVLFEDGRPQLRPFDWRGAVVFCEGAKPAEETIEPPIVLTGRR